MRRLPAPNKGPPILQERATDYALPLKRQESCGSKRAKKNHAPPLRDSLAHVLMSLWARTSVLDMYKMENVMDSWLARDSVRNGSDSSSYDTSNCGTVGAMVFLKLLYLDSCDKWFFLVLVACCVHITLSCCLLSSWDCVLVATESV